MNPTTLTPTRPTTVEGPIEARRLASPAGVVAIGVIGTVFLTVTSIMALNGRVPGFEATITNKLDSEPGSGWFRIGDAVSTLGSSGVVAILSIAFAGFVVWKYRDLALATIVPLAGALGGVTELAGKQIMGRLRPPSAALIGEDGFGFPSGHTTGFAAAAFALALTLMVIMPRRRTTLFIGLAAVASASIAIGRVLVGAHRVLDVVAGFGLGMLCAALAYVVAGAIAPLVPDSVRRLLDKGIK